MSSSSVPAFGFHLPTRIEFGPGASRRVGELCRERGHRSVFCVVDPGLHALGAADEVLASLDAAGLDVTVWTDLQPNPIDVDVECAVAAMLAGHHDVVVGLGGGSAQDTAKAVAVLATNGGRVRDYAGNGNVPRPASPLVLIPTTAGTGSEVTANASITNSDTQDKLAIRDPHAYAQLAILDPELLAGLPAGAAAAAGIDALTHAVESYASVRGSELTRSLAAEAIRRMAHSLEAFVADRSDPDAASSMLFASFLAGIAISHTGTGNAHAVSRALGGRYGIAHGVGCGVALPGVMRFNAEEHPEVYAEIAAALGVARPGASAAENAAAGADRVDAIRAAIGIPARLGLEADEQTMAELEGWVVDNAGPNPRPTSREDARLLLTGVM